MICTEVPACLPALMLSSMKSSHADLAAQVKPESLLWVEGHRHLNCDLACALSWSPLI